jgi:benzoyl-CoA reductase subunit A
LGDDGAVLGRGITNSRSNYDVACRVALGEAMNDARFRLAEAEADEAGLDPVRKADLLDELGRRFREQQYLERLDVLQERLGRWLDAAKAPAASREAVGRILDAMRAETAQLYAKGAVRKSDFFRDLAGSRYLERAEEEARATGAPFDALVGLFDKAILEVENCPPEDDAFAGQMARALTAMDGRAKDLAGGVARAGGVDMTPLSSVGTGYGRARLPFPKEQIRSEILCHGLGAHAMFPKTRTVLDIGGQDTKAIQVDEQGIVTSFQMNDRCAAGCGRYLGYIADEMNLGVHQLGPLAKQARRPVRINSTCTVFAGAELRERLSFGEKREDILAGLHRAIILRAMSLLARSGGVADEFTFTGGVAKNPAAVDALRGLVRENYGDRTLNISADSIYTGALGAALYALHDTGRREGGDPVPLAGEEA